MATKTVSVGSVVGFDDRRAAEIIAEAVTAAGVPVTISLEDGAPVDASNATEIMSLGAGHGTRVTVGAHDEHVLNSIAALVEQDPFA